MYERLIALITEEDLKKINQAHILLVGLGGVGGFAFEALIRSGFNNITIIDGDNIVLSNLNRQIIATNLNIGEAKTTEAQKRALSINKNLNIISKNIFLTKDNFSKYVNANYDYIIDACDDLDIKVLLIKYGINNNIKTLTCLGTGKKLDSTKLEITTLAKTYNDPLAKKLRSMLRKENISLNIPVVFSKEQKVNTKNVIGSAIFVPATAGLMLANKVFLDIIER